MDTDLTRRIRTVQYNDQRFTSTEIDLLHTPALQRLYDLHQLGLADRIFIDASHSRLHHVIGVIEQADKIMRSIAENLRKHPKERLEYADGPAGGSTKLEIADYVNEKILAVRIMGMLHDLTHAPFGHTLEDEIELAEQKHDEPGRQADAFYRLVLQYFGWIERNSDPTAWGADTREKPAEGQNEALLAWYLDSPDLHDPPTSPEFIHFLVNRWAIFLRPRPQNPLSLRKISHKKLIRFLKDLAFAMRALTHLDIAHKEVADVKPQQVPESQYPVDFLLDSLLHKANASPSDKERFQPQRDVFLLDVIGNTICADLLDYARRDAANAGLRLDYDPQRIVDNMTVVSSAGPLPRKVTGPKGPVPFPFSDACLRTCVSIYSHKLRTDVPGELLNLLQVRYFVYERMLYHPTKCVAGAVMGAAIQFIGWKRLPGHWRFIGDQVFLHQASESARLVRDLLYDESPEAPFSAELIKRLTARIESLPMGGISLAATQLLRDRLVTLGDIAAYINVVSRLQKHQKTALLSPFVEAQKDEPLDNNSIARIRSALFSKFGDEESGRDAITWLQGMLPSVATVRNELKAGLRLLDRLGARRYLKITFRLLPNARVKGLHGLDAAKSKIAEIFKKPLERKIAEREIELRAGLPQGSVVIHCPPVKGPTKIAKILISSANTSSTTDQPRVAMLNSIATIDSAVFTKHEEAIKALEEMYASTWRFAVSVAPPHDAQWRIVNTRVSEVLLELLTGSRGEHDVVDNDVYTVREIEELETAILTADSGEDEGSSTGQDKSGSDNREPTLVHRLGETLMRQDEFAALPSNATSKQIEDASERYQLRLQKSSSAVGEKNSTKGAARSIRTKGAVQKALSELLGLEHLERTAGDPLTAIFSRASRLDENRWKQFLEGLELYRPPTPISYNSVSVAQRTQIFETVEAALNKAEGLTVLDESADEE